jgi:hypothetical protein
MQQLRKNSVSLNAVFMSSQHFTLYYLCVNAAELFSL